jgi:hypothetical protein
MRNLLWSCVIAGCSAQAPDPWVQGFNPPQVQAGYTRFISPTIKNITPGTDAEWCQYLLGPSSKDRDILDLVGSQSATGHHAVLYATTDVSYPVGESHLCTEDDMLHISFLGGVGGEGTTAAATQLPQGLYFRLQAGRALLANTHWLNASTRTVDGQAVFDVKMADPDPSHTIADLFVNNGERINIPAGQHAAYDVNCPIGADLNLAMVGDHMHWHGVSAYTELIHPDSSKDMLVVDDTWTSDEQFNPKFVRYSVADPKQLKVGDVLHTHCEWDNQTGMPVAFPKEMCVGFTFYFPTLGQITCSDGNWPL